ncbi:hypothetical protein, partial [Leptotrichia shahii]
YCKNRNLKEVIRMATSSFFKNLELSKEAAEELIKMTEEGFTVNKVPNLEINIISNPEEIKKFFEEGDNKNNE